MSKPTTRRRRIPWWILLLVPGALAGCAASPAAVSSVEASGADAIDGAWVRAHYVKSEHMVPMRDGVRLFTSVYVPRASDGPPAPILLFRTPYGVGPYGEDAYRDSIAPSALMARDGYIVVYQDVRGRKMSEGEFVNMTPHLPTKTSPAEIDESTDTADTIDWLLANVPHHNGRVGMWGISYPGFYCAAGMIDAHPNLVAVSPQAPIADWWYDDFHHHGAFFLPHSFGFLSGFGQARPEPTTGGAGRPFEFGTPDGYDFYLNAMGPLKNANERFLHGSVAFWDELTDHPNYDDFWARRNILPHLHHVAPAVLTVGGWFDAEDLYGPLQIYRQIERLNPGVQNTIVMGPWRHGGWARTSGTHLGNVSFGSKTSAFYQEHIERPFFTRHLWEREAPDLPEAYVFETGRNRWRTFDAWPPEGRTTRSLHVRDEGRLAAAAPDVAPPASDAFISDPARPVPFTEDIVIGMTREYMTDDQRFAARRPDVLVYRTAPLDAPMTIAGPIVARLWVSTDQGDADWIVKLIDVFPGDAPDMPDVRRGMRTGGYQMMVRSEVIRGRFRDGPAQARPFTPNVPTLVELPLQDVLHTFEPGHRLMIQIQSTWFPLVDRNPQRWVDNIFRADESDFVSAEHRVYRDADHPTHIEFAVIPTPE